MKFVVTSVVRKFDNYLYPIEPGNWKRVMEYGYVTTLAPAGRTPDNVISMTDIQVIFTDSHLVGSEIEM